MAAPEAITVKGKEIGGLQPLICVPLVARNEQQLLEQARKNVALNPDLIEWRADAYQEIQSRAKLERALGLLSNTLGEIPLLFTCRIFEEGGMAEIPSETRLSIYDTALDTGVPQLVDVELVTGGTGLERIIGRAREKRIAVIVSYHDFQKTPSVVELKERITAAGSTGADIVKVAVMPRNHGDVLNLLHATWESRAGGFTKPIITMAMGKIGMITRVAGWLFGSDITFAVGEQASAPGQIPIQHLRQVITQMWEMFM